MVFCLGLDVGVLALVGLRLSGHPPTFSFDDDDDCDEYATIDF
jgi:hypothetical protein